NHRSISLITIPCEVEQLVAFQSIQIRSIMNELCIDQLFDSRIGQTANVHRASRREMNQLLELSSGTGDIRTVDRHFFLVAHSGSAARGTFRGHAPLSSARLTLFRN